MVFQLVFISAFVEWLVRSGPWVLGFLKSANAFLNVNSWTKCQLHVRHSTVAVLWCWLGKHSCVQQECLLSLSTWAEKMYSLGLPENTQRVKGRTLAQQTLGWPACLCSFGGPCQVSCGDLSIYLILFGFCTLSVCVQGGPQN